MNEKPLAADARLVDAVRAIELSRRRLAVVVSEDGRLLGTLTDGDIRRCLLAGGTLETPVAGAMNADPVTALEGSPDGYLLDLMRRGNILALPLVDERGRYQRLVHVTDVDQRETWNSGAPTFAFAVIMAGGEGIRLRPLTEAIPKPMVDVGGMPLLERQVQRLADAGVRRAYIAVNYLSGIIEDHFEDGRDFGIEIAYIREREKLGTAGALSLLPEKPAAPIIVMNGDILTTSDFLSLFEFHEAHEASVTVAAVDYHVNIPYGVVRSDGPYVRQIEEKPAQRFLCNAGIYAVSARALDHLPQGGHCNMTDLVDACLRAEQKVAVFPVHEYWSDIGTPDDLEKARALFCERV